MQNLKEQTQAVVDLVVNNFKEFTVYTCGKKSAPIFAFKNDSSDNCITFLYFMHAIKIVDDLVGIKDVLTGEIIGSANKPFEYLHNGAAVEFEFQPYLLRSVTMNKAEF